MSDGEGAEEDEDEEAGGAGGGDEEMEDDSIHLFEGHTCEAPCYTRLCSVRWVPVDALWGGRELEQGAVSTCSIPSSCPKHPAATTHSPLRPACSRRVLGGVEPAAGRSGGHGRRRRPRLHLAGGAGGV